MWQLLIRNPHATKKEATQLGVPLTEWGVLAFVFLLSGSVNTNPRDEAAPSTSTLCLNKKKLETHQETGPGSGNKWQS